jgi:hypothetical protein
VHPEVIEGEHRAPAGCFGRRVQPVDGETKGYEKKYGPLEVRSGSFCVHHRFLPD